MCAECDSLNPTHLARKRCRHRRNHAFVMKGEFSKNREDRPYFRELREDFGYSCAYCTLQEWDINGLWGFFQTDHFERVKDRPDLEYVYTNLVYACERCNNLRRSIPAGEIADPCDGDIHTVHLRLKQDGTFQALTNTGREMEKYFRLNRRKDLQRLLSARVQSEDVRRRLIEWHAWYETQTTHIHEDMRNAAPAAQARMRKELAQLKDGIARLEEVLQDIAAMDAPPPFP